MEFTLYRDLASLAFVRCISPIPGTKIYAEGTGFSVTRAIAKCRSESIESEFQLSHPLRKQMLGIAAHPKSHEALENAWNETLETLVLMQLVRSPVFYGLRISIFQVRLGLGRVKDRFIAIALFSHAGIPTATQAVSKNPFKALLKAWSEVRNIRLYKPAPSALATYTKANRLIDADTLTKIAIKLSFRKNTAETASLKHFQHHVQNHHIAYFIQEPLI